MFYAFRNTPNGMTLTEFSNTAEFKTEIERLAGVNPQAYYERTTAEAARNWVKRGHHHETALWVDAGRVRRAGNGF